MKLLHVVPVWHRDTYEFGYLLYMPKTPKRIKNILQSVRGVSREPGLKSWFVPQEDFDRAFAKIPGPMCDSCASEKPCGEWKQVPFRQEGFVAGHPADFDVAEHIDELSQSTDRFTKSVRNAWDECKSLLEEAFGDESVFSDVRNRFQTMRTGAAKMSIQQAAEVLDVTFPCSREVINQRFKAAAMRAHPDKGGTDEQMRRVVEARSVMREVFG